MPRRSKQLTNQPLQSPAITGVGGARQGPAPFSSNYQTLPLDGTDPNAAVHHDQHDHQETTQSSVNVLPSVPLHGADIFAHTQDGENGQAQAAGWAEFLVPTSDTKGHSEKISLRVQPGLARQCDLALHAGFPYRSIADLVRHAMVRHLHWLETVNPSMPSVMRQVDALMEVMRDQELLNEQEEVLGALHTKIENALHTGDTTMSTRLLALAASTVDAMPNGAWRDSYRQKLIARYGALYPARVEQAQGQQQTQYQITDSGEGI